MKIRIKGLLAIAGLLVTAQSWAQAEVRTPLFGSSTGGKDGEWRCPKYSYLVGLVTRTSEEGFHALTPVCAEYHEDGTRGAQVVGPRFGGMAGGPVTNICPASQPFVRTMQVMTVSGNRSILSVFFECGPMTGPFGPTKVDESFFMIGGQLTDGLNFPEKKSMLCPAGHGYSGLHARGGSDLDAIGALCLPAVPIKRVASFGKKPAPQTAPIRNPADTTTVLSRATGPTMVQQSAAADAALPTRNRQANRINNSATTNVAEQIDANQMICRGGPTLGLHPQQPATAAAQSVNGWVLYFSPARGPANRDGSGLEPGQCGFVDRPWKSGEPPGVVFESAAGAPSPEQHLRNSGNYWFFIATNNGRGMFVASRNGKYLDSTTTVAAVEQPGCGTALVGMRNDLDSRIERIRCENAGLTANQRAQLNTRLDEVLKWIAMAK